MSQVPDEKLQAVVSLVVQAVDQRLNTVREQLVQLAKSVARNQSELQKQIDQCRMMCEVATSAPVQGVPDAQTGLAAQQLMQLATVLTEQVGSFETRVNQYTNERIAELAARLEVGAGRGAQPLGVVHSGPVPVVHSGAVRSIAATPPDDISPAAARLAPLAATPRTTNASAPATSQTGGSVDVDLETLTAQMGERLSAAIEKALGG